MSPMWQLQQAWNVGMQQAGTIELNIAAYKQMTNYSRKRL
jgi:hypothetical protein